MRVLRALQHRAVDFVVIGGVAATLQGATRVTYDLDVTPSAERANLQRLAVALHDLGARIYVNDAVESLEFPFDAASLARAEIWNLITDAGRLDVLLAPGGAPSYDAMAKAASRFEVADELTIAVASIDDLIRMKQAAGRDVDRQDVRDLRRVFELREGG